MNVRRLVARLLARYLTPEPQPSPVYACCLVAKGGGPGFYELHRVRFHGEGQA